MCSTGTANVHVSHHPRTVQSAELDCLPAQIERALTVGGFIAAVRKRLTGKAGLPTIFPLCGVNKEFSAAVLAFEGDTAGSRDGGGSNDRPKDPPGQKNINVRRLTEEQGKDHRPTSGTRMDW